MGNKYKIGDVFSCKEQTEGDMELLTISDVLGNNHYQIESSLDTLVVNTFITDVEYLETKCVKIEKSEQIGGSHYSRLKIDPYEYSMQNELNPLQMNAIKYITRYPFKNGIEDLEKAKAYNR